MLLDYLQRRDLEILRTLGRLRYMTTKEVVAGFFAHPQVGRRRVRRLSGLDLIASHRKGLPEAFPYFAWRLTARGLDVVAKAFPDEPFPDGLAEHLADGSLRNIEHRQELSRLYLGFLAGDTGPMPREADVASMRAVIDALRERASQVLWRADGDVVLRFTKLGEDTQIVPDATVSGRHREVRIFVELDRSTRELARIEENLERYAWFLAHVHGGQFPDQRTPGLLYVVRSQGRKASLDALARRILAERVAWAVALEAEAIDWLERQLIDPARSRTRAEPIGPDDINGLVELAADVYRWAVGYEKELKAEGRALPREGQALFRALHHKIKTSGVRRAG
jgi:hypothetical protein